MKSTEVCVDVSLAIKVVVPEAGSDWADALFNQWADEETQLIAPMFFEVETDSILRQKASLRRELTADQAQRAFASLRALPIKTRHSAEQRDRAWEIASEFQFPYCLRRHISCARGIEPVRILDRRRKVIQAGKRQINFCSMARKLFSDKVNSFLARPPVTSKSQRSAADAGGTGGAKPGTLRNSKKVVDSVHLLNKSLARRSLALGTK